MRVNRFKRERERKEKENQNETLKNIQVTHGMQKKENRNKKQREPTENKI